MSLLSEQLTLTCLGPVHIGSGEQLDPTQYIYDDKERRAYFINESAWIRLLSERRFLKSFIDRFSGPAREKSIYRWCQEQGLNKQHYERIASGWAQVPIQADRDFSYLNKLSLLSRSADGRPYIPGSSIKGYLRTAILHHLIKNLSPQQREAYWQGFKQIVNNRDPRTLRKDTKDLMTKLEQNLLHKLTYTDRPDNAVNSVMQGLRVADAYPIEVKPTQIVRKLDWQVSEPRKDPEHYISLSRECFAPDTKLTCRLTIDTAFLSEIGINSLQELLGITADFTKHILTLERQAFGNHLRNVFADCSTANLFLGGGSGLLSKTLIYSLAAKDEARPITAAMLDMLFRKPFHKHVVRDKYLSPRTIKLGRLQNKTYRMGVCRLELS